MSITIRNRWNDEVIYIAKGAADVRTAVEEAVKNDANLRDANLRDANLRNANLRNAYLAGANLGGANLRDANLRDANLRDANLRDANLRDANLRDANLRNANLRNAYLRGANLRNAYLAGANLGGAYLRDAYLRGAKGIALERYNDLLLLLDQVGKIRAYKLVTADLTSPIKTDNSITYEIGSTVEAEANTDPDLDCGAGINLATLPWCLREYGPGQRILICEFTAKDIAAIPNGDGKFRVHKAKVVREVDVEAILAKEVVE
jgi:uncharacterized protein YjbI with pentapeptide repeats